MGNRGEDPTSPGLEHAALGVGEAGIVGSGETAKRLLESAQSRGSLLGRAAQGGCALGRSGRLGRPGIPKERLAGGPVPDGAVTRQEGGGLPGPEGVATHHPRELHLLVLPEGAQGERRGQREPAVVEKKAQRGGELPCEREAALDPGAFLPQQLPDRRKRQAVIVGEGRRDVGLIHWPDGAGRCVGRQKTGLHHDPGGPFDYDGDFLAALGTPDGQTLEAVNHLVDAVTDHGDTQRERGEEDALVAALAAKDAQSRPESIHGDVLDENHGEPSRDRSWKSG